MKVNLRNYSEDELFLRVVNTEDLWRKRYNLTQEMLGELYLFTDIQWRVLKVRLALELAYEGV
jgi:hypothetical protein